MRWRRTFRINDEGTKLGGLKVVVEDLVKEVGVADVVVVEEPDRVIELGEQPDERKDSTDEVAREVGGSGVSDETVDKKVGPGAVVDEVERLLVRLELACKDLDLDTKVEGVGVHVVVV